MAGRYSQITLCIMAANQALKALYRALECQRGLVSCHVLQVLYMCVCVQGYLDQSFANGTGTFSVHTNYNDEGIDNPPPTQGISFFNLGFSSDAPKTLHTFNTTVLSNAFLPEWVTFNGANCSVVLG